MDGSPTFQKIDTAGANRKPCDSGFKEKDNVQKEDICFPRNERFICWINIWKMRSRMYEDI